MGTDFLKIPKYIPSCNENFKILNKFKLIKDEFPDKFIINLFYLENKLCLFKITRIDSNNGWDKDLKIIIYSIDENNKEVISLGKSYKNSKNIEIYTEIDLIVENRITFDKNIIQTIDNDFTNYQEVDNFYKFIYKNLEHNFNNFNYETRRSFILDNYKSKINLFDLILCSELKKKIFILCYLNLLGGIYLDENVELNDSISNIYEDKNLINIKDNNIYFLSIEKDNINLKKLFSDLKKKSKLDFKSYINNHKVIDIKIKKEIKIEFKYYDNIFNFKNFKILIMGNENNKNFVIEEMQEGYYLVKEKDNNKVDNIIIKYINLLNNEENFLKKENYKFSKDNLKIFRVNK